MLSMVSVNIICCQKAVRLHTKQFYLILLFYLGVLWQRGTHNRAQVLPSLRNTGLHIIQPGVCVFHVLNCCVYVVTHEYTALAALTWKWMSELLLLLYTMLVRRPVAFFRALLHFSPSISCYGGLYILYSSSIRQDKHTGGFALIRAVVAQAVARTIACFPSKSLPTKHAAALLEVKGN